MRLSRRVRYGNTEGKRGVFKQLVRTMVHLASLLGILSDSPRWSRSGSRSGCAQASGLTVLVALGRIAFARQLASVHHLASPGIHCTRRRGGGSGGGGGGGCSRTGSSLPLAHVAAVLAQFRSPLVFFSRPPRMGCLLFPFCLFFLSLSRACPCSCAPGSALRFPFSLVLFPSSFFVSSL